MIFQDVIEKKSEKEVSGGHVRFAFKLTNTNQWVSSLNNDFELEEGDEARFECEEKGGFVNLKSAEKIISGDTPADTGIKDKTKKPPVPKKKDEDWHVFKDKEYQQAKDDLIVKQMAYKAAVDSFSNFEPGTIEEDRLLEYCDMLVKIAHAVYYDIKNGEW